ncbi:phosphotransferase [Nocardioides taihuensis]|uniref:Phosphotransferase n=1 Tax=Nocardioides taihuensis TaxID=1835606 RepID=A0ABW0BNB0_9ACTN
MTSPAPTSRAYPVPSGRTARRLEWPHLPPNLRAYVERHCGSPVVEAVSQGAGFTPGFASVLTCEDGSRHFVKAASVKAQRMFADSYREEARKLAALPPEVAAPRLLWFLDDDWVVLGVEHVEARHPARPWDADDLGACLDALAMVAEQLTPAPEGLGLDAFVDELADWPSFWDHLRTTQPDLPHLEEAAALAAGFAEGCAGDTVVHTDVRDDNVLIDGAGKVWFCDWNWPTAGAAWLDSVFLLIGPRGDGVDVETVIAGRPLLRDVPREHVDAVLALVTGYFLRQADEPVPRSSPFIREHQRWQGQVCWDWLCERRGWR